MEKSMNVADVGIKANISWYDNLICYTFITTAYWWIPTNHNNAIFYVFIETKIKFVLLS